MVVSTLASLSLEALAQAAQTPSWFQLYTQSDRVFTKELVRRAEQADCQALVVTVDAPVNGVRSREQRAGFDLPPEGAVVNLYGMQTLPPQTARAGESPLFHSSVVHSAAIWAAVA